MEWALLLGHQNAYCLAGIVLGCVAFGRGFRLWRRKRWIEDTPRAKVRSLPLGRVEVFGRAEAKGELVAPLSGRSCAYYRYLVEERVGSGSRRRWRTVARGDSSAWPFYLEDDTGRVLVDPRGAVAELRRDLRDENVRPGDPGYRVLEERGLVRPRWLEIFRRFRLTEWRVGPGEPLYVLGVAQERPGQAQERRRRIGERLAALKSDPEAMAHLDTDGDGRVSAEEWEVARQLAVREAAFAPIEDRVLIGAAPHGEAPFYLCDRHEASIVRSLAWRAAASVIGGAALALACLGAWLWNLERLGRI